MALSLSVKASRNDESTASLSSPFQCVITLLMFSLNTENVLALSGAGKGAQRWLCKREGHETSECFV